MQTDTVVRRTARGDDGTLVKTTTRDRAVNPTFDAEPRPATSVRPAMSALLRPKGALPPATGTPSSAATPTPDVDAGSVIYCVAIINAPAPKQTAY